MLKKISMRSLTVGALLLAVSFTFSCTKKVTLGKDEVIYKGTATEQEAQKLGAALKDIHYFADRGVSVILTKDSEGTAIAFVVQDGVWDKPDAVQAFTEIGRTVAPAVGGLPIKLRLANTSSETKKEIPLS